MINYPIKSVQFSLKTQLAQLVSKISTQKEIGLLVICHPQPFTLCAICIPLRECEYLIDVTEIPSCIQDINPILADPRIVKVVHNSAKTCHFLHLFGAGPILNVFCISPTSFELDLNPSPKLVQKTSEKA